MQKTEGATIGLGVVALVSVFVLVYFAFIRQVVHNDDQNVHAKKLTWGYQCVNHKCTKVNSTDRVEGPFFWSQEACEGSSVCAARQCWGCVTSYGIRTGQVAVQYGTTLDDPTPCMTKRQAIKKCTEPLEITCTTGSPGLAAGCNPMEILSEQTQQHQRENGTVWKAEGNTQHEFEVSLTNVLHECQYRCSSACTFHNNKQLGDQCDSGGSCSRCMVGGRCMSPCLPSVITTNPKVPATNSSCGSCRVTNGGFACVVDFLNAARSMEHCDCDSPSLTGRSARVSDEDIWALNNGGTGVPCSVTNFYCPPGQRSVYNPDRYVREGTGTPCNRGDVEQNGNRCVQCSQSTIPRSCTRCE
jgi:hypothetical protein